MSNNIRVINDKAGLSALTDTSGKLLKLRRASTRKDVIANTRDSSLQIALMV